MSEKQDELVEEQENAVPEESVADAADQEGMEEAQGEAVEELSELDQMKMELEALKQENSNLKDQYLRKQADFENYRKRMLREKEDTIKYGNSSLLSDLIDIVDNFERAIQSGGESADLQTFHDGIVMIEQQFSSMLSSKYSLEKLQAEGQPYDPNQHEALMMEESDQIEEPTVLQVFQSGYKLHDRILRPAKVKVGQPAPKKDSE